jgi:predicted AlkP superfamily phosphohydrolase/phosphomutase
MKIASGEIKKVHFRGKLLDLSDDAADFKLYLSSMGIEDDDYVYPPELSKEIKSEEGLMAYTGGYVAYSLDLIDLHTWMETQWFHDLWLTDVATYLLKNKPWDLFTMHYHAPDWFYHGAMTDLDPMTQKDEKKREMVQNAERRMYQSVDEGIGRIMEVAGKDAMFMIVSDHGAMADGPPFNPYDALIPAGLAVLEDKTREWETGGVLADHAKYIVKWDKTKAVPQRDLYIYVNLKGRDPNGIVEPEDYDKVVQQIIDALYDYKDPKTGRRVISLALSRKDSRILGLYGDCVGDVVYALDPIYGAQHGQQLPASELGPGDQRSIMIMYGPGFKKGYRLKRNMWLTDIVPTLCHIMNWPVPKDVEGSIVYQAFKDPNVIQSHIENLQKSLDSMEKALSRGERQPWDKHDCA